MFSMLASTEDVGVGGRKKKREESDVNETSKYVIICHIPISPSPPTLPQCGIHRWTKGLWAAEGPSGRCQGTWGWSHLPTHWGTGP